MGKLDDLMHECNEWKLDVMCLTETQMRESVEISDDSYAYNFMGKGCSKQVRKGGGVAIMWKKDVDIESERLDIGSCAMSEDVLAVKLEFNCGNCKKEVLYLCVCYMTVEGDKGKLENPKKYELLQKFMLDHQNEKIMILGDMNGHIGILGERMNKNGELMREMCENASLEILNETIAEGKVTWCGREFKSAIDFVLVNENARKSVLSMWIDEEREFNGDSDHNLLQVVYDCDIKGVNKAERKRSKWRLNAADWEKFREGMNAAGDISGDSVTNLNEKIVNVVSEVARRCSYWPNKWKNKKD